MCTYKLHISFAEQVRSQGMEQAAVGTSAAPEAAGGASSARGPLVAPRSVCCLYTLARFAQKAPMWKTSARMPR